MTFEILPQTVRGRIIQFKIVGQAGMTEHELHSLPTAPNLVSDFLEAVRTHKRVKITVNTDGQIDTVDWVEK